MGNRIFLASIFSASAYFFYATFFLKKNLIARTSSPEGMPRVVLAGIMLVTLLLLWRDREKNLPSHVSELFRGSRLYVVVGLVLYLPVLPWAGFSISSALLLFILFFLLAPGRPQPKELLLNAAVSILLAGGTFFLFRQVFHIQLPVGPLGF